MSMHLDKMMTDDYPMNPNFVGITYTYILVIPKGFLETGCMVGHRSYFFICFWDQFHLPIRKGKGKSFRAPNNIDALHPHVF